ncbi:toprim domain-containing protein [Amycolatopsis sp. NPDC051903]|uniref:toprim domain-containing protein n=1 Tax=Amycolatopsis sp. NPDC051903 TaxID=3363936 RepID=UPI0037BB944C
MATRRLTLEERASKRAERVTEVRQLLDDAAASATTAAGWRSYLDTVAGLPGFSAANALLVYAQQPGATDLRDYDGWAAAGRQVRRGERGVKLLHAGSDASSPRVVSLFDVAQTGPEAPTPTSAPAIAERVAADRLWDRLSAVAEARGWSVRLGPLTDGTGRTDALRREIRVRDSLDDIDAVRTLAHEVAHVVLDHHTAGLGPSRTELEAASMAYVTLRAAGVSAPAAEFDMSSIGGAAGVPALRETAARVIQGLAQARHPAPAVPNDAALATRVERGRVAAARVRERAELGAARSTGVSAARGGEEQGSLVLSPTERARLVQANTDAMAFFTEQLAGTPRAHDYVVQRLGVAEVPGFQLGYAPAGWTSMVDHLRGLGHPDDVLLAAGLAQRSSRETLIDRFRDRVLVAVRDGHGDIAGFIGRPPSDRVPEGVPKYLNTPATDLFDKSRLLFGLPEQRERLASGARPLLIEGVFDVLAIAARGDARVAPVAALGTSVTPAHLAALADTTDEPIVVQLDGDAAGQAATERVAHLVHANPDLRAEIASALPDDHDPASWLATGGELARVVEDAESVPRWLMDRAIARLEATEHSDEVEKQVATLRSVAGILAPLSLSEAASLAADAATRLGLPADTVAGAVWDARERAKEAPRHLYERAARRARSGERETAERAKTTAAPRSSADLPAVAHDRWSRPPHVNTARHLHR